MSSADVFLITIAEPVAVIIMYELTGWVCRSLFPGKRR